MIYYVIKRTLTWTSPKTDAQVSHITFLGYRSEYPIPMNHMVMSAKEAKIFDCKSEAQRFIDRHFSAKDRNIKIVKIVTEIEER